MTLRAVVDPNVFVSAQSSSLGHPARIARAADEGVFELVVSERLLSELRAVLMRPRFRLHMTEGEVRERENMQSQERFLLAWNSVRHLTNLAHHEGGYSREEAYYILGVGALALSLAANAPGVLKEDEEQGV